MPIVRIAIALAALLVAVLVTLPQMVATHERREQLERAVPQIAPIPKANEQSYVMRLREVAAPDWRN